jgi:hypothetical protein
VLVALCSSLLQKSIKGGLAVTGGLNAPALAVFAALPRVGSYIRANRVEAKRLLEREQGRHDFVRWLFVC